MTTPSVTLPPYILEQIFMYLDFTYAFELSLVCREFSNYVMTSSTLWRAWWTTHAWLRRDHEIPRYVLDGPRGKKENGKEKGKKKTIAAENEEEKKKGDREGLRANSDKEIDDVRDWRACCRRRYEHELEQVDYTSDICWIALQGNATAIRKLVSLGTSIHFDARSKTTPLHCAAERGNVRAMRALIALGADVNASRDVAPLHIAARYGRILAIELLLAHAANLDCRTARSSMPLHYAAIAGDNAIDYLVRAGSCVNSRDKHNDTPLHEAAESGNLRAARELVRLGADVNAVNEIGCTPLHFAAEKPAGLVLDLVRELVAMGALVDAEDNLGLTPYHLSVWRGQDEVADELARMGAKRTKPPEGALYVKCMQPGEFVYSPGHGYVKKNNTTDYKSDSVFGKLTKVCFLPLTQY